MNIINDFLSPNPFSRPKLMLDKVKGIVIHYVANPGTSAKQNRDFFENRKFGETGYGSAHFIIDLDGSIIQCISEKEIAYHVGAVTYIDGIQKKLSPYPNDCTIGIECTHIDLTGIMTDETYYTLIGFCTLLCRNYHLDPDKSLYLHYEITGKICHKWFVDNPLEWEIFKNKVKEKYDFYFKHN